MELTTGKVAWTDPSIGHGALVAANGQLIVVTEQGVLQIGPRLNQGVEAHRDRKSHRRTSLDATGPFRKPTLCPQSEGRNRSPEPSLTTRPSVNRRTFLSATAASFASAPFILGQAKTDRKYRTALIGSGWWGMNILRVALEAGQSEVVALADVDADVLEISADEVLGLTGKLPKTYKDYRELLETRSRRS